MDIWNNTPNTTNPTRAQVAQFGDNYLLDNTPLLRQRHAGSLLLRLQHLSRADRLRVCGLSRPTWATAGNSTPRLTRPATGTSSSIRTAATVNLDHLQAQRRRQAERLPPRRRHPDSEQRNEVGHVPHRRLVRLGLHRPLPDIRPTSSRRWTRRSGNFHEHFITQSFQPFAEYEWHATPKLVIIAGIKAADYNMALESVPGQRQDRRLPRRHAHHVSLDGRHLGRRAALRRRRGLRDPQRQLQQLAADDDRALPRLENMVGYTPNLPKAASFRRAPFSTCRVATS